MEPGLLLGKEPDKKL
jgi:hypothetical protein